jgi:hypothetical protein
MDCVKWPWKRDAIVDYFTASTVSILPTGSPKKMWVRIRQKPRGEIRRSFFGAWAWEVPSNMKVRSFSYPI